MKYSLMFLLLVTPVTMEAQIQKIRPHTEKVQPEKRLPQPPKKAEAGFDVGYCPTEYGGGPTGKIVFSVRTEKHVQLFVNADAVKGTLRNDFGIGFGSNFPIGSNRSYFYPGVYVGYYFRTSVVAGGQIGYVGYISDGIALHIEGGCRWGANGGSIVRSVFYAPVVAGIRFSLD